MKYLPILLSSIMMVMISCDSQEGNENQEVEIQVADSTKVIAEGRFINPPIEGVNVPYEEYMLSAEDGGTLYFKTGSIIIFPPDAFVDEAGDVIKGDVKVEYREFVDPLDFYLAGVSMNYDSAGVSYNFESAGMCEINAYSENKSVFVNQNSQPEINLASNYSGTNYNLYHLDTNNRNWINKGKDDVTNLDEITVNDASIESADETLPEAPIEPQKPSGNRPSFTIALEPGVFSELEAYDNLKFEIDESDDSYNPEDAKVQWNDVKLTEGKKSGTYIVKFIKGNQSVSYITRPVFEGQVYEYAMKLFKEKEKVYKKKKEESKAIFDEQMKQNLILKDLDDAKIKENARIEKLNILIEAKNAQVTEENKAKWEEYEKTQEENKKIFTEQKSDNIMRSFSIPDFGFWNCDNPMLNENIAMNVSFNMNGEIVLEPATTKGKDVFGNDITLLLASPSIHIAYTNINGIVSFPKGFMRISPGKEAVLWAYFDKKFYYVSKANFKKSDVNFDERVAMIRCEVYDGVVSDKQQILDLLGL